MAVSNGLGILIGFTKFLIIVIIIIIIILIIKGYKNKEIIGLYYNSSVVV